MRVLTEAARICVRARPDLASRRAPRRRRDGYCRHVRPSAPRSTRRRRPVRLGVHRGADPCCCSVRPTRQALAHRARSIALAAALAGRPPREVALVLATVLVGQTVLGWDNDLVDEPVDRAAERTDKPLATGGSNAGTVGFAAGLRRAARSYRCPCPAGSAAGLGYLLVVLVGLAGNRLAARAGCCRGCPGRSRSRSTRRSCRTAGGEAARTGARRRCAMTAVAAAARRRRPRPDLAPGASSPTTRPVGATSPCASPCGSGHPDCRCWRSVSAPS